MVKKGHLLRCCKKLNSSRTGCTHRPELFLRLASPIFLLSFVLMVKKGHPLHSCKKIKSRALSCTRKGHVL